MFPNLQFVITSIISTLLIGIIGMLPLAGYRISHQPITDLANDNPALAKRIIWGTAVPGIDSVRHPPRHATPIPARETATPRQDRAALSSCAAPVPGRQVVLTPIAVQSNPTEPATPAEPPLRLEAALQPQTPAGVRNDASPAAAPKPPPPPAFVARPIALATELPAEITPLGKPAVAAPAELAASGHAAGQGVSVALIPPLPEARPEPKPVRRRVRRTRTRHVTRPAVQNPRRQPDNPFAIFFGVENNPRR